MSVKTRDFIYWYLNPVRPKLHLFHTFKIINLSKPEISPTDSKDNFEIKDLLPGKYKVRFWHEGFEEMVKEVEVKAGGAMNVYVTFKKTMKLSFLGRVGEFGF